MEGPRTGPGVRGAEGACHLVFLPDRAAPRFFVWGAEAVASPLSAGGTPEKACLVDETLAPRELAGVAVPLLDALPLLAAMTAAETDRAPGDGRARLLGATLRRRAHRAGRRLRVRWLSGADAARRARRLDPPGARRRAGCAARLLPAGSARRGECPAAARARGRRFSAPL